MNNNFKHCKHRRFWEESVKIEYYTLSGKNTSLKLNKSFIIFSIFFLISLSIWSFHSYLNIQKEYSLLFEKYSSLQTKNSSVLKEKHELEEKITVLTDKLILIEKELNDIGKYKQQFQ